ncbi:hypothetical protein CRG98_022027 [Punica granatum]|uniref:Uncharacterized protein n=1 Tax=Punica granatum TaxID=22663 RepID=A0A2I0JPZ9_PUNGR|nr:hypothetical protein CRG98_022027 [Punica granatum]
MFPVESPSYAHSNFVSSGHACARPCNVAWECPPSRGRATDAREKESPLLVYDPKVEGREPGVGSNRTNGWRKNHVTLLIAVGSVELPGHVRPRLTYSIRVVFHIDTTRSEAVSRNKTRFRTRVAGARCVGALDPVINKRGYWTLCVSYPKDPSSTCNK